MPRTRDRSTRVQTALKIDRDAFLLPIAKAHRFRPVAPAQFRGQFQRFGGFAPLFGLGKRALCGGWQVVVFGCVAHGVPLGLNR